MMRAKRYWPGRGVISLCGTFTIEGPGTLRSDVLCSRAKLIVHIMNLDSSPEPRI
jgi:hypothetical protein